jgi:uncharacterized Zn finger protein
VSEASEQKAIEYLTTGKVQVLEVGEAHALITVQGSAQEPYNVHFGNATWYCGCPARKPECAHVIAAKLICPLRSERSTSKIGTVSVAELDQLLG